MMAAVNEQVDYARRHIPEGERHLYVFMFQAWARGGQ